MRDLLKVLVISALDLKGRLENSLGECAEKIWTKWFRKEKL